MPVHLTNVAPMQKLSVILEVDLLLLGFSRDGAFEYEFSSDDLENVLTDMHDEREICPTVWETGEPAALCHQVHGIPSLPHPHRPTLHCPHVLRRFSTRCLRSRQRWEDGPLVLVMVVVTRSP